MSVEVRASEPLSSLSVTLFGTADAGSYSAPSVVPLSVCDAGYCARADLKLWAVPMEAFRAPLTVRAFGNDLGGNPGTGVADVKVTRWKWVFTAATAPLAPPAVDVNGNVAVTGGGRISFVDPAGSRLWVMDTGAVTGAPSIGRGDGGHSVVYVGVTGGTTAIFALSSLDGGEELHCPSTGAAGSAPYSVVVGEGDIGNGLAETAMGAFGSNGRIAYVQPYWLASGCGATTTGVPAAAPSSNALTDDGAIFWPTNNARIASYSPGNNSPRSGFPATLSVNASFVAWNGVSVVGGAATSLETGFLFAVPDAGGSVETRLADAGQLEGIVFDAQSTALVTTSNSGELLAVGGQLTSVSASRDAGSGATLVLGAGGTVYSASSTSPQVAAWTATGLRQLWSVQLGSTSHAAPGIDPAFCGRGNRT